MGGPGSGSGFRARCKLTVEECFSLDVNALVRRGVIGHGVKAGRLATDGPAKGYEYVVQRGYGAVLYLTLRWRVLRGTDICVVEDHIPLETTDVHLGGWRWWFNCPLCHRRCGTIHRPPGINYRFACRVCHKLNYRSQQEGPAMRHARRMSRIRRRLSGDGVTCSRPKGMHRRTFDRLLARVGEPVSEYEQLIDPWPDPDIFTPS